MNTRVDPTFVTELKKYGIGNWNQCFHCGICTAICPLTENGFLFPRRGIHSIQMGLKNELEKHIEPWLCYYCGDCSKTCPRDANPGELMMTLRRYLTSVYDWTGISGRLYRSFSAHLIAMIILFVSVVTGFAIFHGQVITEEVRLNTFAPVEVIHIIDHVMLFILGLFLLSNMSVMFYKVMLKDKNIKIPVRLYFKHIVYGIFHFLTQSRFSKCEKKTYWFGHLYLMMSYIGMFVIIIFFLKDFQIDGTDWQMLSIPGYIITLGLLIPCVVIIFLRLKKKIIFFRFSHHSDWIFISLLTLLALSGILIHFFRINNMAVPTYVAYVIHLAVEVPMVVTFVAFSKWSHLAYRPLAIYFYKIKKEALSIQEKLTHLIPA